MSKQSSPPIERDHGWRIWWQLTRPHTLTAGFVPVFLGTALALHYTHLNISLFIAMLIASLLIQAATNMFNEYYDYKRGLDNEKSVGIGGAIVRNGVHPKTVLRLAFTFFGIAILLGVYICMNTTWWIAVIGTVCMLIAYFYTGGPYPIAYTPFGEFLSGFFMGVIIVLISFYIQVREITADSVLISIPIMILIGAIMLSNNIRDLDGDKENGRRTVAILIGRKKAINLLAAMFTVSYVWIIALILFGGATPWLLLILISIPKPITAVKGFIGKTEPIQMLPAMKATAQTNTFFGLLLSIGLVIAHFF
ncbi:1,4-dihydroxy-2-naphthoate octaprenyltransferase [Heyndrickxia shackletonii]|uniref:1,4-dihydroxy-2-naphthoate octaprenyltransferase n=1 Tax=Heyndrickxia shackletonii TaxID=157838 RepID=A0A0Q3WVJ0_9BACI|nr:1,4-dihydroxy-2-naphthoate polyprenyltransferase [Heyndrickxia shackletonii]KQL53221.1 1,4-dihydroxy-2-naphthoate octaprenyltransferase [Heyndrickxia shackletonii]MBB2480864.1 1,4-dihydroxy-2-naphthoate polyprenyltransferase [Bacillus sp. APMAM]NEZ01837.1 1,4-dihydroxy-2-naphthoate polyprenyltransferase [Heyndrickxia shackletonii]RTZ55722.1 1,4-dihydroxy-2-naphthoate polyprenyltransferase [Bacillus sp. SAJ1]